MDLGAATLDHLVLGCRSLEEGVPWLQRRCGVQPQPGGRHSHGETENGLLALGPSTYLELIAPVPGAPGLDPWAQQCRAMAQPRLFAWCLRHTEPLETLAQRGRRLGLQTDGPGEMGRTRPDGAQLRWRLLDFRSYWGDTLPFFIEWLSAEHPAASTPPGAALVDLRLGHPEHQRLQALLLELGIAIAVISSPVPGLHARLETPLGPTDL
jgi:hypothetical protein